MCGSASLCVSPKLLGTRLPWRYLRNEKVKRSEWPQKLEIESDEIEFELNVHMLLLFSASLLVLLLPLLLGFSSPPLSTFCGTVCSSSIEMIYWCQVVNLLSLFCSSPVVFRGSSHFLLFPPTCQKTQVDHLWRFAEKPLVWGKCHDRSLWCFPLFLFKVLKVSFHRTLVVELTPETFFFKTTTSPLSSHVWAAVFQFGISQHFLGAELCKTSCSVAVPSGLEGYTLKCH